MYIVDNRFPSLKAPSTSLSVPDTPEHTGEDRNHDEGKYRLARDYPVGLYSYLDYAEVEENAHNVANYDAAEALDMK